MTNGWRIPTDAEDYFRNTEKRIARQERRPQPMATLDLLGAGMAAQAVQIMDWSAEDARFNGFYHSAPGSVNSPEQTLSWTGQVIAKDDGTGMQQVWNTDGPETLYWMRTYEPTPIRDGNVIFGVWKKFATSSGFIGYPEIDQPVVDDIEKALDDAAAAIVFVEAANKVFRSDSEPVGTVERPLRNGDTWFDTDDDNRMYVYDGVAGQWVNALSALEAQAALDQVEALAAAQAAADAASAAMGFAETRSKVYWQGTMPTEGALGDSWVNTSDGNRLYVHDGATYVDSQDAMVAAATATATAAHDEAVQATENAAAAMGFAETRNKVYWQGTMPVEGTLGDSWIDTSNGNRLHVHNGVTYMDSQDAMIAAAAESAVSAHDEAVQALDDAAAAMDFAETRSKTFRQDAEPTMEQGPFSIGDVWFDTNDGNRIYTYDGAGFSETRDAGIAEAQEAAGVAQGLVQAIPQTFFGEAMPTGTTERPSVQGDVWYNTLSGNQQHRWDGENWVTFAVDVTDFTLTARKFLSNTHLLY